MKRFNNNRGAALAMVILLMALGVIIVGMFLTVGVAEHAQAEAQEKNMQSYYIARSAATMVAQAVIDNPSMDSDLDDGTTTIDFGSDTASVTIQKDQPSSGEVLITATVNGSFSRAVKLVLDKGASSNVGMEGIDAVDELPLGNINVLNSVPPNTVPITINSPNGFDGSPSSMSPAAVLTTESASYQTVYKDNFDSKGNITGNATISENGSYGSIIPAGNKTVTFETGAAGNLLQISADEVNFTNDTIRFTGSGTVVLYVGSEFTAQTPNFDGITDPTRFFIMMNTDTTCMIRANSDFFGYIYGPEATVDLQSSSGNINGAIVCETLEANPSGHSNFIYYPAAQSTLDQIFGGYSISKWID